MKMPYQYFQRTIPAGGVQDIAAYGGFITLLTNNGAGDVEINIQGQGYQPLPAGLSIELPTTETFNLLQFQNPTGLAMTIEFSISNGRVYDNRTNIVNRLLTTDTAEIFETYVPLVADDTGTITIAADPDVLQVYILNSDLVNDVYIGDLNVDYATARGIYLAPGDAIVLNTRADIFFMTGVGLTANITYARLKKV
jgi:hypothetical protein